MIQSLWLPIIKFGVELIAHGGKVGVEKLMDARFHGKILSPKPLIELREHFFTLRNATIALASEASDSPRYGSLRTTWVDLFAPAVTALHNLDPRMLSALGIYSPRLADLLRREIVISAKTLQAALEAERAEMSYDTESHLCTLCLQVVREWSKADKTKDGLVLLAHTLKETIDNIDSFVKANWSPKDEI